MCIDKVLAERTNSTQPNPSQVRPNPSQVQLRRCCLHFVTLVSCGDSVKWQFWVLLSLFASLLHSEGCLKSSELRVVHFCERETPCRARLRQQTLLWRRNCKQSKTKAANHGLWAKWRIYWLYVIPSVIYIIYERWQRHRTCKDIKLSACLRYPFLNLYFKLALEVLSLYHS